MTSNAAPGGRESEPRSKSIPLAFDPTSTTPAGLRAGKTPALPGTFAQFAPVEGFLRDPAPAAELYVLPLPYDLGMLD